MNHAQHVGDFEGLGDADGEAYRALRPEGPVAPQGFRERHPFGRLEREVERAAGRDAALVHRGDRGTAGGERDEPARVLAHGPDKLLVAGGIVSEDAQSHPRAGVGALGEVQGILDPGHERLDCPVRAVARGRGLGRRYGGKRHRRSVTR